jgi:large subunit ribosomal protein L30
MATNKKLKVTLSKSTIAIHPKHKECVKGLGLRRIHQAVVVSDTPCNRGMINKVSYLLSVEEV